MRSIHNHYECKLETPGYRLHVLVFTEDESAVEGLALQRAVELFKKAFGMEKKASDFITISVSEK